MKRKSFRSRPITVALIAALLSSVAPLADASVSPRNIQGKPEVAQITPAKIADVKVTAGPTGVLIEWRSSFELDHFGFNVYREQAGSRTQVNPAIIAGAGLIAAQGTPLYAGYTYQWFDAAGNLDARYYLEDLDLKGMRTLAGPFTPVWNDGLLKAEQAGMNNAATATQGAAANQEGGPAGTFEKTVASPAAIQDQWAITAQAGLKIGVKQDGWYRVTQPDMIAAGFVPGETANLRLFVDAREVPIEVSRSSGPLTPNDFLEFYGTGLDTLTTDTHVYYLINGSQAGLRVPVFGEMHPDAIPAASPRPSPPAPVPSLSADPPTRFSSGGGWFGPVSTGVEGVRESRIQPGDSSVETPAESARVISESGLVAVTPTVNVSSAPARAVTPTTSDLVKAGNDVRVSPATPRALSQTRRKPRKKNRRRRGRRSHAEKRKLSHAVASLSSSAGFLYDVQLKDRFVYFSSLLNGAAENYFGFSLLNPPYTQQNPPLAKTLKITNLQTDFQGTALLQIGLQGTSQQAHLVDVLVNEVVVGSISYDSQQYAEQTFNLAVSQLHEGDNVIKFMVAGGSGDRSLYSYARLTYPRTFRASNDTLAFSLRSTQTVKVDGFTTPNIRMLDISDPMAVQAMRPIVEDTGSGFSLSLPSIGAKAKGSRIFLAYPIGSFLRPASLVFNQQSALNQAGNPANAADLLIISHQAFIASLAPLVARREAEGFTVKVVDIEDVFDEFSYGMHTPQAITDFVSRARSTWIRAPRYLLLVGDASYDPRNYEGGGSFDLVPTKLIDTFYMETGSDDTLTDFDGDGIPEVPVGRLPIRTVADANLVISKIVNFSPSNVPQTALMVADTQGSYFFNFEQANEDLIPLLPLNMQANVQRVYRSQQPSDATARANIIAKLNQGPALVNYSGHGSVNVWTGAPIFSTSDAIALTNGNKLSLVIVMDCLNGYFVAPPIDCISEALMKAPNGGAVASFSSSGLTIPIGQHAMGQQLFNLLYSGAPMALGDATRQAKAATTDIDVRRSWILFGDPSMKIR